LIENEPNETLDFAPPHPEKHGCATSFLNGKRNEIDTSCDLSKATNGIKEYVQPDKEKEAGGEA
jgi:hypothetical protein